MTTADSGGLRIGDTERGAADRALQEHLTAGRLTLDEYGERSALVYNARTQADLAALFADLPGGTVAVPGVRPVAQTGPALPADQAGSLPIHSSTRRKVLLATMGAMPLLALLLFFLFDSWLFFLLIPISGAIIGPFLNQDDDRDRR